MKVCKESNVHKHRKTKSRPGCSVWREGKYIYNMKSCNLIYSEVKISANTAKPV